MSPTRATRTSARRSSRRSRRPREWWTSNPGKSDVTASLPAASAVSPSWQRRRPTGAKRPRSPVSDGPRKRRAGPGTSSPHWLGAEASAEAEANAEVEAEGGGSVVDLDPEERSVVGRSREMKKGADRRDFKVEKDRKGDEGGHSGVGNSARPEGLLVGPGDHGRAEESRALRESGGEKGIIVDLENPSDVHVTGTTVKPVLRGGVIDAGAIPREETGTAASHAGCRAGRGSVEGEEICRAEESHTRSDVDMGVDHCGSFGAGSAEAAVSFAESGKLQFQTVDAADGGSGKVEVAIALSLNSSYTGVLEVPPQTDTGTQRALRGDEFFFVHTGSVVLELGITRFFLRAGDHIAIPNMACYSFHNKSRTKCKLVFFVPRNPFS